MSNVGVFPKPAADGANRCVQVNSTHRRAIQECVEGKMSAHELKHGGTTSSGSCLIN